MKKPLSTLGLGVGLIGVALFVVGASQFLHQRQSAGDPSEVPGSKYIAGRTLAQIPDRELAKRPNETPLSYVARVSSTVHAATYHCSPGDFSLSPIESALNWYLTNHRSMNFDWEQGVLGRNALLCGFCHQRAIVLSLILRNNGVDAWAFGVNGHVVAKFSDGGHDYLVDPDSGSPRTGTIRPRPSYMTRS